MGAVSSLPAFLDALRTALAAVSGLSGVKIYTGPVSPELLGAECIVLASDAVGVDAEYLTVPKVQAFEGYDVPCMLATSKPGGAETGIKAARDRAFALLELVHDYLAGDRDVSSTVRSARVVSWTLRQRPGDHQHEAIIEFVIHVRTEFTPA